MHAYSLTKYTYLSNNFSSCSPLVMLLSNFLHRKKKKKKIEAMDGKDIQQPEKWSRV